MATAKENVNAAVTEAIDGELTGKKWYLSKTFWTNVLAAALIVAQTRYGYVVPLEYQTLGLTALNVLLRKITKEPVVW